jgi:hypothetical protein
MGFLRNIRLRLQGQQHEGEGNEYQPLLGEGPPKPLPKTKDPPFYTFSPLQQWVTPLMKRTEKTDFFDADDLPTFSKDTHYLRRFIAPLEGNDLAGFIRQREIGGQLLIGGALEVSSSHEITLMSY